MSVLKRIEDDDDGEFALPPMIWLTPIEAHAQFDQRAREMVGMSGEEFLRRLDAGEYADIPDDREHRAFIELGIMSGLGR